MTSAVSAFGFGYFRDWPNDSFDPTDLRNWVVIGVFLFTSARKSLDLPLSVTSCCGCRAVGRGGAKGRRPANRSSR